MIVPKQAHHARFTNVLSSRNSIKAVRFILTPVNQNQLVWSLLARLLDLTTRASLHSTVTSISTSWPCSSLEPILIDTDLCRPGTPNKSCSIADTTLTLLSSHHNFALVKLVQILTLILRLILRGQNVHLLPTNRCHVEEIISIIHFTISKLNLQMKSVLFNVENCSNSECLWLV